METTTKKKDAFQIATESVIAQLQKGIVPWKRNGSKAELPRSFVSGKPYRGVNVLLLTSLGYEKNVFLTYDNVQNCEGSIKSGEKSHPIIYWKQSEEEGKPMQLRYYKVYNIAQCERVADEEELRTPPAKVNPVKACEEIVARMQNKPKLAHISSNPYYAMEMDVANIPERKGYDTPEEYYEDAFRQLIHSTGHPKRLNRQELQEFAGADEPEPFSSEELIAEIGIYLLKLITGMQDNSFQTDASYIQGWLNKLKGDHRLMVYAAAKAQKAVDYILNVNYSGKKEEGR